MKAVRSCCNHGESFIDRLINIEGWQTWNNKTTPSIICSAEYANTSPESPIANQVKWHGSTSLAGKKRASLHQKSSSMLIDGCLIEQFPIIDG